MATATRPRLYDEVRLLIELHDDEVGRVPAGTRGRIVGIGTDGYDIELFDDEGETIDVLPVERRAVALAGR